MRFIKLPWRLYRNERNWVPPLISERKKFLDRDDNPFFEHAEAEYFLAWRDGEPVGRICAHVDRNLNEYQDNEWGLFGFFEAEDDPEVARGLLEAADDWLRAHGRDRMVGPMDFTTNDECGLLVEGHERRPLILQGWHHPYYRPLLEGYGLDKSMDLYMWELRLDEVEERGGFHPMIQAAAKKVTGEHGVTVRHMRKRDFEAELGHFLEVYNAAWERNWGFVPMTEHEIDHLAEQFKPVVIPELVPMAEKDGKLIGFGIALPDLNVIFRTNRSGRLFPVVLRLLWALKTKRIRRARILLLGVIPAFQGKGVDAMLYHWIWTKSGERGIYWGEAGWILEDNPAMNAGLEKMTFRVYKTYRLYDRRL
jgi:GNAT superfamily N-acetyltransferase